VLNISHKQVNGQSRRNDYSYSGLEFQEFLHLHLVSYLKVQFERKTKREGRNREKNKEIRKKER
jgi:hypothetical protein